MYYIRKIFRKTNISYPLIRTRTCAYQGVRNVGFSENFTYVLNDPITEPAAQKIPENLGNTRDFTVWVNFTWKIFSDTYE